MRNWRRVDLSSLLRGHLSSKLVLNAYIILAMRLFANASGFVFWAVAARLLPSSDVGLASGVVSVSALLAGLAQLGLGYGLVRHLHDSRTPVRLLNAVLVVVTGDGLVFAVVFLAGLSFWAPALLPLRATAATALAFVLLVVVTGLTQLLNWHFLARRAPLYSLVKNSLQSALALILLVVLGWRDHTFLSAVYAYSIATLASLVVAVLWFLPRVDPDYTPRLVMPRTIRTSFASYSLTNFVADQFARMAGPLVPLVVLNILGPDTAAYFFIAWSISAGLASLTESAATSFFAESAHRPQDIGDYRRRSIRMALLISAIGAVGAIVVGRFVLLIYGPLYVENAYRPLVVLAITLIPASLLPIYNAYLRVRDQLRALLWFTGADIGLAVVCIYLLMGRFHLMGAVAGWFVSRCVLVVVMGILWRKRMAPEGSTEAAEQPNYGPR